VFVDNTEADGARGGRGDNHAVGANTLFGDWYEGVCVPLAIFDTAGGGLGTLGGNVANFVQQVCRECKLGSMQSSPGEFGETHSICFNATYESRLG